MANIDAVKILGNLLNSGVLSRGSGSNVLGSIIGALTGSASPSPGGGLGGLVGSILGGRTSAASGGDQSPGFSAPGGSGLGDLLGGLMGGGQSSGGGLGDLLGMALNRIGRAPAGGSIQPNLAFNQDIAGGKEYQQAGDQATVLIRAMINAAKADGQVDQQEHRQIVEKLGDITPDEVEFLRQQLAEPLDIQGFVRSVPRSMEQQVYAVSLMAIDLDTNKEAKYLHELAQGLGISAEACNAIHEQFGAPQLYR